MLKAIRSRSKRDSKRSKGKHGAAREDTDASQHADTVDRGDTRLMSKYDLKEKWRRSDFSTNWSEFAARNQVLDDDVLRQINHEGECYKFDRLVDHLVEGPDETTVSEDIYAAFQDMYNDPSQGLEGEGMRGDDQESMGEWPELEAEHAEEEDSFCAQADEEDSDHDEQELTTVQSEMHTQRRIKRRKQCYACCRLVMSVAVVVALSICVLHFTELENHVAEIIMNNPLLSGQWDLLGGRSIRILVTGKTGTGKSALINGLMGQKVAVEGDTLDPETSEVQQIKRMVQGVSMSIFDSPGLQDGTQREREYLQDMQWKCRSIDVVLYAIRMTDERVHAEDTKAMKKLTKAFGVELWNRAIFVLTFANAVQDPVDPEDEIKNEAHFKKRLEIWRENLPEIVAERTNIPIEIAKRIPIVPAGYYNIRDLPGQSFWFTKFWLAVLKRMREAGANGADYMLEFGKDRIKKSNQATEKDFEKPIYEQPILYEE